MQISSWPDGKAIPAYGLMMSVRLSVRLSMRLSLEFALQSGHTVFSGFLSGTLFAANLRHTVRHS